MIHCGLYSTIAMGVKSKYGPLVAIHSFRSQSLIQILPLYCFLTKKKKSADFDNCPLHVSLAIACADRVLNLIPGIVGPIKS